MCGRRGERNDNAGFKICRVSVLMRASEGEFAFTKMTIIEDADGGLHNNGSKCKSRIRHNNKNNCSRLDRTDISSGICTSAWFWICGGLYDDSILGFVMLPDEGGLEFINTLCGRKRRLVSVLSWLRGVREEEEGGRRRVDGGVVIYP